MSEIEVSMRISDRLIRGSAELHEAAKMMATIINAIEKETGQKLNVAYENYDSMNYIQSYRDQQRVTT